MEFILKTTESTDAQDPWLRCIESISDDESKKQQKSLYDLIKVFGFTVAYFDNCLKDVDKLDPSQIYMAGPNSAEWWLNELIAIKTLCSNFLEYCNEKLNIKFSCENNDFYSYITQNLRFIEKKQSEMMDFYILLFRKKNFFSPISIEPIKDTMKNKYVHGLFDCCLFSFFPKFFQNSNKTSSSVNDFIKLICNDEANLLQKHFVTGDVALMRNMAGCIFGQEKFSSIHDVNIENTPISSLIFDALSNLTQEPISPEVIKREGFNLEEKLERKNQLNTEHKKIHNEAQKAAEKIESHGNTLSTSEEKRSNDDYNVCDHKVASKELLSKMKLNIKEYLQYKSMLGESNKLKLKNKVSLSFALFIILNTIGALVIIRQFLRKRYKALLLCVGVLYFLNILRLFLFVFKLSDNLHNDLEAKLIEHSVKKYDSCIDSTISEEDASLEISKAVNNNDLFKNLSTCGAGFAYCSFALITLSSFFLVGVVCSAFKSHSSVHDYAIGGLLLLINLCAMGLLYMFHLKAIKDVYTIELGFVSMEKKFLCSNPNSDLSDLDEQELENTLDESNVPFYGCVKLPYIENNCHI